MIGLGIFVGLILAVIGAFVAFMKYSVLPLEDGAALAGGRVRTVITDHFGPVAIGAYVFDLKDGGVGLIDAGTDPDAKAIVAALGQVGKTAADVRGIFLTHQHNDHIGGAQAFSAAQVYVLEPDRPAIEARGIKVTRGVHDGERVEISGTPIEVFALPGHTPGSAAFLVHGVLFLGDSAAAAYNSSFQANTMMGTDPAQTARSLLGLSDRLQPRRSEIQHLAFGHQGSLVGVDPMLTWAATFRANQ